MKYFDLKVGFSCNNNCVHCVITDKKNTKDLTTEELKKIIDTIPPDTMVGFTGGEATIRKDFIELLKYSKKNGNLTALQSNVAMFHNFDFAKEASKYLDNVLVAIHSHIPEIHNSIVRTSGMYDKTIEGFKNLIKLGVDCSTQTVISKLNINNILETYDFIQSISPGIKMNFTYPHLNGNAWTNRDIVAPRFTEIKDIIHSVIKKYGNLISTEAIPKCYLYPYHNDIYFNFDEDLLSESTRPGIDPANINTDFFDEEGRTEDYKLSQLSEKRKGPKCKECIFNDSCVGVWKEYAELFKDKFDLFPIYNKTDEEEDTCTKEDNNINEEWGSIIIYSDTGQCMNRCTFCSGGSEIIDEKIKFDTVIKDSNYFINNHFKKIEISGGDPGEYNRIVDVVKYLSERGIEKIQLSTHGRTLKNENLVIALKEAGVTEVRIPLYGSTDIIHNKTVQYHNTSGNAFQDTVDGIKNCSKHGILIVGHTLMNQYNKNDMNNILQLYIDISKEQLKALFIGVTFISDLSYDYTNNWYLPIKDLGPYIREVYHNHPTISKNVLFKLLDIPYCVLGEYSEDIYNIYEGFPNLGLHDVEEENRSDISEKIPHYRIKSFFNECNSCIYKDKCGAIPLNEIKMFGTYGLKGFKE